MIIIDYREKDIVKRYFPEAKVERIEIDGVDVGDFTNDNMDFLVERKAAFDFKQSLISGHLENQLARMVELYDGPKYLIFEGDLEALIEVQHDKGIKGWITSFPYKLAHVYGIQFIQTWDTLETAKVIKILDKYAGKFRDPKVKFEPIYVKKTRDIRVKTLMNVYKLGQSRAELLLQTFGSIQNIIDAALNSPKLLTSIDGIGKKTVEHIVALFVSDKPYTKPKKNKRIKYNNKEEIAREKALEKSKYNNKRAKNLENRRSS